jgi:transposase
MMPTTVSEQAPVSPPAYHRAQARLGAALRIDALTLVRTLHLLTLCRLAVRLAHRRCPSPLPAGPGGAPRTYSEASFLLIALLRTLWRLSYQDMHDWLVAWPALALACGLPLGHPGQPRIPSPSQQWKRAARAGAPVCEALFVVSVLTAIRPRVIRLDAAYWGLRLIAWIHATLHAVAVIPWNPKRQLNRSCLPPTWTKEELGKRSAIERFFGRLFLFFHLQRPPRCGWSAIERQVALTYIASIIVGLAAQQAGRPDLIRSPKRVLAHSWEAL